jgi:hypothetical protein
MPNLIRVFVEDSDALLNVGMYDAGAIVRLQSCATETGAYVNEATAALVTLTRSYTLYDADGLSSTWYRTRYENAGGTVTSDWSPVFQVGAEEAGYLCSLEDVRQRLGLGLTDTTSDEDLAEFIRQVTTDILGHTGREFVGSRADETRTFDAAEYGTTLYIPGGIRTVTTLNIASSDQPDTSGTYTATTAYYIRPLPHDRTAGWPATRIDLIDGACFYPGHSTVQIVGKFGWSAVPPDIAGIATSAVVRRFQARQSSSTGVDLMVGSADMGFRTLAFLSPAERAKLDWYAVRTDG